MRQIDSNVAYLFVAEFFEFFNPFAHLPRILIRPVAVGLQGIHLTLQSPLLVLQRLKFKSHLLVMFEDFFESSGSVLQVLLRLLPKISLSLIGLIKSK